MNILHVISRGLDRTHHLLVMAWIFCKKKNVFSQICKNKVFFLYNIYFTHKVGWTVVYYYYMDNVSTLLLSASTTCALGCLLHSLRIISPTPLV